MQERESEHYEKLLRWQAIILAGGDKPEDLSEHESREYDQLLRDYAAAEKLGYAVAVPGSDSVVERPATYLIAAEQAGGLLLLVKRDEPTAEARTYNPGTGELSAVAMAGSFAKFMPGWEDYDGPQDVLADVLPDDPFALGPEPVTLPLSPPAPEVRGDAGGADTRTEAPLPPLELEAVRIYPDTDVMTRFLRDITLGASKPEGLAPIESEAWDELAAEVDETRKQGYIIDIPPE